MANFDDDVTNARLTRRMSQSEVVVLVDSLSSPLGETTVVETEKETNAEKMGEREEDVSSQRMGPEDLELMLDFLRATHTSSLSSFSKKMVKTLSAYFPLTRDRPLHKGEAA